MTDPLPLLKLHAAMPGLPETDHPSPERLITGNPRRDTWNDVDVAVGGSRLYCGVWRSEPGHWRIRMADGEHELFTVLQGRCRVHHEDGRFQEAGPGEAVFIHAGFAGSFEVLETVTKTYAIVAAQPV
ncbi:MAG: cupin domain-containing protein [Rubrivivax sp.]